MHLVLLALAASFSVHVLTIVIYVLTKAKNMFYAFLVTAFSNITLGMVATVFAFKNPGLVRGVNLVLFFWHLSGLLMLFFLCAKLFIVIRIIRRTRDPKTYHVNFFGKKVYNEKLVSKAELNMFLLLMPFFLICGAYFVSKLITR